MIDKILAILHSHALEMGLVALLAASEALAEIPAVKANSVFQAVVNGIKFIKDKLFKPAV